MSKKLEANITCPHCGHVFKMELYRSIWGEYPKNRELVLSDKINVAHCPHCHRDTKLQFSLLYTNTPKNIAVWWEPEFDPQVEADAKGYRQIAPGSHLANAPRIRDWNEFKNKIKELEGDEKASDAISERNIKKVKESDKQGNKIVSDNKSDSNTTKQFIDIKFTLTALLFLALTLLDYKKCRYGDDFCYNFPYGFYEILKFVICGYFLYRAMVLWQKSKVQFGLIISILAAITYNPFVKIAFEKSDWYIINIVTIFIVIFLAKDEFAMTYQKYNETKAEKEKRTFSSVEKIVEEKLKNKPMELQHLYQIKANNPEQYKAYVYQKLLQICNVEKINKTIEDNISGNQKADE